MSIQDTRMAESSLVHQLNAQKKQLQELTKPINYSGGPSSDAVMMVANRQAAIREMENSIAETEERLAAVRADLEGQQQAYKDWQNTENTSVTPNIPNTTVNTAANWQKQWADQWERFQAEQSGDPFAGIELDRTRKLGEAGINGADKEIIDQINTYYGVKRTEVADKLMEDEKRRMLSLTRTKVDDLEYELEKEFEAINRLEDQRVFAAAGSEEEIAALREQYSAMRVETYNQYEADIAKTEFEEARAAVVDWRQTLNDSLSMALLDMEGFSSQAAVILGDLSAQFLELSASSALDGFEEFGRALGEGENAADSLQRSLAAMARQILKQLPMMFLQAGLQLIANGQWAMGLGFIAASASTAIMSGYVDSVSENAKGGVYDEYGRAAAFARGGIFTNHIVDHPTFFRFASGAGFAPGVMGEAGPEAIMPLKRGPDGRLGVSTAGGAPAGGTAVYVIIQNYTNEEVQTQESSDGNGNQIRKIIIGAVKESISTGEMDRPMASRYGIKAQGV
jgi:phage-related minor tail protein